MKIGYVLNTYPVPSATFIRREIQALEERGESISRFAMRRFSGKLVDPLDRSEAERTQHLFEGNLPDLLASSLREILVNLPGLVRAWPIWRSLLKSAGGGIVRHTAYLMQAASLRQKATHAGIRHFHAHFGTNSTAVAMLAHALGGPAYSFTAHGPDEFEDAQKLGYALKIERAAFVIAISDYCRCMLASLASAETDTSKIHVARCGIRIEEFATQPPVTADNTTLVCVGRLCTQKGQVHIPAAVAALRKEFPALRVILVGDGESREAVEAEIARFGVGEHVVLHGWGTNTEVRNLISTSRALLLPSYAEGLPIVLMEALALGRPVISTTIAGIPELVDASCGWLATPGNHAELVAVMRAALAAAPEKLQAMGAAGRQRVEAMHDITGLAGTLSAHFAQRR